MQDDSNSESTFEFVDDKKADDTLKSGEAFGSLSSSSSLLGLPMMSTDSSLTPSPVFVNANTNILSAVAPPSALPNFIAAQSSNSIATKENDPPSVVTQTDMNNKQSFSAAIPSNEPIKLESQDSSDSYSNSLMPGSGFMGWVKGAVSSGGILHRVAEKAKNSVDTMITTLDPQMREFIYSGGDLELVVASDKEVKISPIREAFQMTFGKATVSGLQAQSTIIAAQPVGLDAALAAAKERICILRSQPRVGTDIPIVAIENYIEEIGPERWYDMSLLLLTHPSLGISIHLSSQGTPLPAQIVTAARQDTPPDYKFKDSGFSITIGSLMAENLQVHHSEWHKALTGVSRREIILLAARSLAGLYKNALNIQST
uniref:Protein prrc1-like isoform x1 polistes canadensis n=1 Tax=Xenopsylla cheopis TaxID=163159 RepID=A0A6M2DKF4_XENCH